MEAGDWGLGTGESGAVSGQPIADNREWGLEAREYGPPLILPVLFMYRPDSSVVSAF